MNGGSCPGSCGTVHRVIAGMRLQKPEERKKERISTKKRDTISAAAEQLPDQFGNF